jgi:hypothetical protein
MLHNLLPADIGYVLQSGRLAELRWRCFALNYNVRRRAYPDLNLKSFGGAP